MNWPLILRNVILALSHTHTHTTPSIYYPFTHTGVFSPTLFSKAYGNLVCERCNNTPGNVTGAFVCQDCHYEVVGTAARHP